MCAFEMKKSSYRRLSFICAFTKKNFFCCIGIIIHTTKHTEEHSWVSNEKTTTAEATEDDEYDDGGTESLFILTIAKLMSCIYCHRLPLLIKSHQKLYRKAVKGKECKMINWDLLFSALFSNQFHLLLILSLQCWAWLQF